MQYNTRDIYNRIQALYFKSYWDLPFPLEIQPRGASSPSGGDHEATAQGAVCRFPENMRKTTDIVKHMEDETAQLYRNFP